MIGQALSHFNITAKLGEGGMGEVYRADDIKLGREVAIKVLPESVANDPERLARFDREAKVLASLNHPNIAAIYSLEVAEIVVGESLVGSREGASPSLTGGNGDGGAPLAGSHSVNFLVMELVEGEDLKEQLERGALPYETVQPISLQIAEALEAAHEKGIIHRDLKPANIKVTPEGQVKVLDFGLAKALDPTATNVGEPLAGSREGASPSPTALSLSPTLTAQMTQAGVLMGTAAYMSPEQARGQQVDQQADIWAYGAVLYEMLTGQGAFPGTTVTDVMAAVVTREPDWDALPTGTPWHVRELLSFCLAKDPRQRIHDIADARLLLTSPAPPESESSPVEPPKTWRRLLPWGLAGLMAVIAGGFALSERAREAESASISRFSITLPPELFVAEDEMMVLSPDGSKLVMVGFENGVKKLLLRSLDTREVAPLPGTEAARNPFFSPDGKTLGFTRDTSNEMVALSLETGRTTSIAEADWGAGSWSPNDTIVYTPYYTSGLHQVSVDGGQPVELTEPHQDQGELGHFWPQHLPGGETVIFTSFSVPLNRSRIEAFNLETGETTTLIEDGVFGRFAPTGHLLFIRDQMLMAVGFDLERIEVSGAPTPIVSDVIPELGQGDAPITFAANGTLAYVPGALMNPPRQLVWVDRQGVETPFPETHRYKHPRISPDGTRVAVTIEDKSWDLWVVEVERGTLSRVSFEPATQFGAAWTPDGQSIVYSQDDPPYNLYRRPVDGGGQPEMLLRTSIDNEVRSISPDGTTLLYRQSTNDAGDDIWHLPLSDKGDPQPWLTTPFDEDFATFSPDGRWVSYTSAETGKSQVYVRRFAAGGRKIQISLAGGSRPRWSHDGRELYFRDGPRMMAVEVAVGAQFTAGEPQELFSGSYMASSNKWDYDMAPDGRFIMIKTPDEDRPREISVVLNWFQELESLVPTD